jgi:hypothetical protein
MRKACTEIVPKNLNKGKNEKINLCWHFAKKKLRGSRLFQQSDHLQRNLVISLQTRNQTVYSDWKSTHSPKPKKTCMSKSKIKTVFIIFFNIKKNVLWLKVSHSLKLWIWIIALRFHQKCKKRFWRKGPEL